MRSSGKALKQPLAEPDDALDDYLSVLLNDHPAGISSEDRSNLDTTAAALLPTGGFGRADSRLPASLVVHRTAALGDTPPAPLQRRWVVFSVGDEYFGIDVLRIREVVQVPRIRPVPGTRETISGVMNFTGNIIPVVNTRSLFGLKVAQPADDARIIVIGEGERLTGLLVDSVSGVIDVADAEVEPAPRVGVHGDVEYIGGVVSRSGRLALLINVTTLLAQVHGHDLASSAEENVHAEGGTHTGDAAGATGVATG